MNNEKRTILIVDDEKDLLLLIKEVLEEHHYHVLIRQIMGKEALDLISQEGVPDLILLDMSMPVMNGWTFSQLFADNYGRSCPIVIMTAADDSETRAMEIGADSYLGKPFDMDTLIKVVESILTI